MNDIDPMCGFGYCNGPGPMTKEHLWPAALHRRFLAAENASENAFWLRRVGKEIGGEPQIGDVCNHCNNGHLSELDAYICELFDRYFLRMAARYDRVIFEFDYHHLKRWLLKMCVNSGFAASVRDVLARI